ncbi:hypothetical protein A5825_002668 [Enterococcus gallinarum]|nr:hypothetical protein A5825_002668 [Enterococcus gallinarum]
MSNKATLGNKYIKRLLPCETLGVIGFIFLLATKQQI